MKHPRKAVLAAGVLAVFCLAAAADVLVVKIQSTQIQFILKCGI